MDEFELAQTQVEECRKAVERGDYPKAILALKWSTMFELPLPDWLAEEAETAMLFYFAKGGSEGKGKRGGILTRHKREKVHRLRHHIADWELARRATVGGNREEAFRRASERLKGTFARGSPEAVEDSYDRVQAQLRSLKEGTAPAK